MAAATKITVSVEDMPETLVYMRNELAAILRAEADSEADPRIARRLRSIAASFEAGQRTT